MKKDNQEEQGHTGKKWARIKKAFRRNERLFIRKFR